MSSQITVITDSDNTGVKYDAMLKYPNLLKDTDSPVRIYLKNKGTKEGKPIAMIAFHVVLPDGTTAIAQTVTTVRLLKASLQILKASFPDL